MNLYIESIKLWFKGFSENSQRTITYPFIPNKINVITQGILPLANHLYSELLIIFFSQIIR